MSKKRTEATVEASEDVRVYTRTAEKGSFIIPSNPLRARSRPVVQAKVKTKTKTPPVEIKKSYSVSEVLRMGKDKFFEIASPKEPIPMPDFEFSEEELKQIDRLVAGENA